MNPEIILQKAFGFADFATQDWKQVLNSFQQESFEKGENLIDFGVVPNKYYYVINGMLRSYVVNSKGNDVTTGFYAMGDLAQDLPNLFLRRDTEECIETLCPTNCWSITYAKSEMLFHSIEAYRRAGRGRLVMEYAKLKQRSNKMVSLTAQERYLSLISKHSTIFQVAQLKHIASYLGITNSSLSRIRRETAHA